MSVHTVVLRGRRTRAKLFLMKLVVSNPTDSHTGRCSHSHTALDTLVVSNPTDSHTGRCSRSHSTRHARCVQPHRLTHRQMLTLTQH
ncbi:hypothetical protein RRG08_056526 [Elysia crispata]|uniref:Uncharacterized protein n=1 Tax=Elysia crispata TaxID=231223 RepID=A0AAE1DIR3_9GAST|nr:hypothetical protein RRG08_056526 [Elysia crispata]